MVQEWMIFPGRATQGRADGRYKLPEAASPVELRLSSGVRTRGFYGPAIRFNGDGHNQAATILFFYGNGMCLASAMQVLTDLRHAGMNVVAMDYPGYGMSEGEPGERPIYEMADAVYDWATDQRGIAPQTLIPLGWSLGGAPAVHLASRRKVGALILMSAFTSLLEVAKREFPLVPVQSILRHPFENLAKISQVKCPVLIIHGRRDRLVPFEMAEKLRAAAGGQVRFMAIDEAGHNDIVALDGERVLSEVATFARGAVDAPS